MEKTQGGGSESGASPQGLTKQEQYLMGCPSMPKQNTCCVCGGRRESMHHVVPRSRGGHNGPQLPLCGSGTTGCHGTAEAKWMWFDFTDGAWWWNCAEDPPHNRGKCRTDDEWSMLDAEPEYDTDDELAELLEMGGKVDYLIGQKLIEKERRFASRKELGEWLCETYDFSPKSIDSWISKRIAYGKLRGPGVETLGISRGYQIAKLAKSFPLDELLRDYHSMSYAQFKVKYLPPPEPKPVKTCPQCGAEL